MAVLGPSPNIGDLTRLLSPELLARLAADLLAMRKHTSIRIVDGPGDGCRDVHSIAPDGRTHLTQCKFKRDPDKTASSAELQELPIALMKFGCRQGLFVTNGKISPQGKREYLNDYPDYKLEFLEGLDILREFNDSSVLSGVWFNGAEFAKSNLAVAFPLIRRDLETDRAISLADYPDILTQFQNDLKQATSKHDWIIQADSRVHLMRFDPYRPPARVAPTEGLMTSISSTVVLVRGDVTIYELQSMQDIIVKSMATALASNTVLCDKCAVRIGKPELVPLSGSQAGARYELDMEPRTYWCVDGDAISERSALRPLTIKPGAHGWVERSDARVSECGWVRLYHPHWGICCDCQMTTRPSIEQELHELAVYEAFTRPLRGLYEKLGSVSVCPLAFGE